MPKAMKNILVPIDFSPRSRECVDFAVELAKPLRAKLTLLHVIEPMVFPSKPTNKAGSPADHGVWAKKIDNDLAALAESVKKKAVQVTTACRTGRAFHEITSLADSSGADLIVIGSEGYAGGAYALLGSTAERVARRAPCPVLLVRKKGRALS